MTQQNINLHAFTITCCQCRFIVCSKCITLVGDAGNVRVAKEAYGNFLYVPLNYAVNWRLKIVSFLKSEVPCDYHCQSWSPCCFKVTIAIGLMCVLPESPRCIYRYIHVTQKMHSIITCFCSSCVPFLLSSDYYMTLD